jgi:hypothetical protein
VSGTNVEYQLVYQTQKMTEGRKIKDKKIKSISEEARAWNCK